MSKRIVSVVIFSSLVLVAGLATAQTPRPSEENSNCVVTVKPKEIRGIDAEGRIHRIPLDKKGVVAVDGVKGDTTPLNCFPTFSDAIHFATNGWVNLPSDTQPSEFTGDMVNVKAGSTVLSVDYDGSVYSGSSLTYVVSNDRGCKKYRCGWLNLSWCWSTYYDAVIDGWWNDRISSTNGNEISQCYENIIFEHSYYGGAHQKCTYDCAAFGILDNNASSRRWCRSGDNCDN